MALPTLLDIAKTRGSEGLSALIEEVQLAVPEIQMGASRAITGIQYKQNVRTSLPGGSFRNANEGTSPVKSEFEERLFNCFIANPNGSKQDSAVAKTAFISRVFRVQPCTVRLSSVRAFRSFFTAQGIDRVGHACWRRLTDTFQERARPVFPNSGTTCRARIA